MRSDTALSAIDPIVADHVTLPDAVIRLTAKISDADVNVGLDQILGLRFGFQIPNGDQKGYGVASSSMTAWKKRERAIGLIRQGLCDGSLRAVVFNRTSERPFPLDLIDWRSASFIDQIIRSGFICASVGESIGRHLHSRVLMQESTVRRWLKQQVTSSDLVRAPKHRACLNWLTEQMRANPERAPKLQKEYFREAKKSCHVSGRQCKKIWKQALQATGAQWGPGRPPKSRA